MADQTKIVAGVVAVALAAAGGAFLGRNTATPGTTVVKTEHPEKLQPVPEASSRVCVRQCKPLSSGAEDPFAPGRCVTVCPKERDGK